MTPPLRIRLYQLAALVSTRPFFDRAAGYRLAGYDVDQMRRRSPAFAEAATPGAQIADTLVALLIVYKKLRSILLHSLTFTLVWTMAAVLVDAAVRWQGKVWKPWVSGAVGIASLVILAWTTLGRLEWQSWSRETSAERADQAIYWLLYGVGTFLAVLALCASD